MEGRWVGSVESRRLLTGTAAALTAAEKRINKALKGGIAKSAPDQIAKAQAMYGC